MQTYQSNLSYANTANRLVKQFQHVARPLKMSYTRAGMNPCVGSCWTGGDGKGAQMELTGISALVTGGGSGLGFASASALVDRGARVVIVDLPSSRVEETAEQLGATFVSADILDTAAMTVAFDVAVAAGALRA